MKTWKIKEGGKEYKIMENADEISVRRDLQLKEFLMQKDAGVQIPSLIKFLSDAAQNYDAKTPSKTLLDMINFVNGAKHIMDGEDPDQMIFTIICNEPGEDITEYDKTQAKEKLARMNKEGLTQGQVAHEVEVFIKGSPRLSSYYLIRRLLNLPK